jgi:tRNA-dihydrouridine synthase B
METTPEKRFGLTINGRVVRTPIAIASMAGTVDAAYALERADNIGAAFIGGYSIDGPALEASRMMAAEGREEFLFDDPVKEIGRQLDLMSGSDIVAGVNIRAGSPEAYGDIAKTLGRAAVYEIDAHCRQLPMVHAGCGEYLLTDPMKLISCVKALKAENVTVSVKIRAGVNQDDAALCRRIWMAGADLIHIDLMDLGYAKLRQIRNSCPAILIANNSLYTFDRVKDMFSHGADLVSLARRSDERTLAGLDAAISRYADEHGWYNSPKQLCRGGDIRALAFCCMPVKRCPLIQTLGHVGMSREEYIELKQNAVVNTPLYDGKNTCFGSLTWCCKDSSPCMFRGMAIKELGLTDREYMREKRILSQKIMRRIFHEVPVDSR